MARIQFFLLFVLLSVAISSCSNLYGINSPTFSSPQRFKRGITRTDSNQQIFYTALPNEYGSSQISQHSNLQDVHISLLEQINSEIHQIENILDSLLNHFNSLHQNIKTNTTITEKNDPSAPSEELFEKNVAQNYATIATSIGNLKSAVQHLESEVTDSSSKKNGSHNLHPEKVPIISPHEHYHVSKPGALPEFLTLDPLVAYGPSPMVNFAPPAPGAAEGSNSQNVDLYSPPDGVLLAPPAPGKLPIRTKNF